MEEERKRQVHEYEETGVAVEEEEGAVGAKDRGLFDGFGKKDEEKKEETEVIVTDFEEKVQVSEAPEQEKKPGLLEKLHRSGSSTSSSSDEEEGEEGEKKKKQQQKKKEKKQHDHDHDHDTTAPEEKKGFIEKIKEKLPGAKMTSTDHQEVPPPPPTEAHVSAATPNDEGEGKEKKGLLDKIKEKLPGYHAKTEEDKDKETGSY